MVRIISFILAAVFFVPTCMYSKNQSDESLSGAPYTLPELHIECVINSKTIYERQPVSCTITLFSTNPDVEYANPVGESTLKSGNFDIVKSVEPAGAPYQKKIGGRKYYCFPLKTFVFTIDKKGKYELSGGKYVVGVARPVVINDPFWGPVKTSKIQDYEVPVITKEFKVKSLPTQTENLNFSGTVGNFTLETIVPEGDIIVDEEATAFIILKGTGMIGDNVLPEYRNAFTDGLKLKSISESRSEAYDNGNMISELKLECTFIPNSRDNIKIGECTFDFFDPLAGKYTRIKSEPVEVVVKSSVSKRDKLSI